MRASEPTGQILTRNAMQERTYDRMELRESLVELSGIEPLASSLRIQGSTPDTETSDETK